MKTSKQNTKDNIINSAQELFCSKGYKATSMSEIASRVGITKSSLYYFFKNKEAMYMYIIKHIIDHSVNQYTLEKGIKPTRKLLQERIEKSLSFSIRHGAMITVPENISLKGESKILKETKKSIKEMKKHISFFLKSCGSSKPDYATQVLIDSTHAYVKRSFFGVNERTPKEWALYLSELLIK